MQPGSTKRRSDSGRHRTGGGGSGSTSNKYRPRVHAIIPEARVDKRAAKDTSVAHSANDKAEKLKQNELDAEQLKALEYEAIADDSRQEAITNPIDDYVQDLIPDSDSSSPMFQKTSPNEEARSTSSNPIRRNSGSSSTNDSKTDIQQSNTDEKESLSGIINRKRDEHLNALEKKHGAKKRTGLSKLNFVGRGRSRAKKAIIAATISAFAAGAVAIVGVLPSALESILTGATTSYSNFSTEAIVKKVFNDYFKEDVLLAKCREKGGSFENCNVATSQKTGLLARAREDMRANKMNQKLIDKGISWDYDPNTNTYTIYRFSGGVNPDLVAGGVGYQDFDIFELGQNEGSKYIDSLVRTEINNTSRWKKYFIRGPTMRAMRTRTGSTGCFFLCKQKDSFNNAKKWPKKAFGRFVKQHVLWPSSELLSNIVDCLISGGASCSARSFHNFARSKVAEAAAKLFNEEFAQKILSAFDGALDRGVTRYILEKALEKLIQWITGKVSAAAASNVAGIILFLFAVGKLAHTAKVKLPRLLRIKNLMIVAAASSTFMIMINEMRRGTMPLADFGAMLSTFVGMGGSRIFASIFMGPDNKTAQNGQPYSCNNAEDGGVFGAVSELITPSKMQPGDLTCKSFKFDFFPDIFNNPLIDTASDVYEKIAGACFGIGGIEVCGEDLIDKIDQAIDFISGLIGDALNWLTGGLMDELTKFLTTKIDSLSSAVLGALSPSLVTDVFSGVTSKLAPQGARVFDALAGGASGINQYFTARDELGGGTLSGQSQLELDNAIAEQQAQDTRFASRFDRFFNLDATVGPGPSLLAQLSASTPANYNVASFLNPMKNLSLAFTSASNQHTYASNSSNGSLIGNAFATPVKGHNLATIEGIAKGTVEIEDPESEKCEREKATWKQQIEDRTDSLDDSKADVFGFGIPDGDGSGKSPCLLADTSLKVLTTHRTNTDEFPYGDSASGDNSGGGGGGGGGGNNEEPVVGDTSDVQCKEGSNDAGEAEGWSDSKKYSIRLCTIPGFTSTSDEDGGLAKFNSTISANVVNLVAAAKSAGQNTLVTSSFRTYAKQAELYACAPGCTGGNPVAKPGRSNHQMGFAFDIGMGTNSNFNLWMRSNGETFGYKWFGSGDVPHFSVTGK